MRRCLSLLLACALLALLAPTCLAEPDYAAAGLFGLPWACGEGHVITWDPPGHWEANKASGVAYDFRMTTGTALYAPTDGLAYFLRDDRPFETNLGNYIDLITLDGNWLIRMAHLRDPQTGERQVRSGDLLGYSGASGVQAEHLHLELFIKVGQAWAAPEQERLLRLYGLPRAEFFEGAMLTNDTCATALVLAGQVTSRDPLAPLGQTQRLSVPLRNDSLEATRFDWVQVSLFSPLGLAQVADVEGDWLAPPRGALSVDVPALPAAAGDWYVGRVTLRAAGKVGGQPASGALQVGPSPVTLLHVLPSQTVYDVGDRVSLTVLLRNDGAETWQADDLVLSGVQSNDDHWQARLGSPLTLLAGEKKIVTLAAAFVPQQVGAWWGQRLSYIRDGRQFALADADCSFGVAGQQLVLERIQTTASKEHFTVLAILRNVGSSAGAAQRIEAWGWQPDGETSFVASVAPGSLVPGQSVLVALSASASAADDAWQLVDVGYWLRGVYYSAGLPRYVAKQAASEAVGAIR